METLWGEQSAAKHKVLPESKSLEKDLKIRISDGTIHITTQYSLHKHPDYQELYNPVHEILNDENEYSIPLRSANAFVLRFFLRRFNIDITPHETKILTTYADKIQKPFVTLNENRTALSLTVPPLRVYREIVKTVNGYPVKDGTITVKIARILDLEALNDGLQTTLPKIAISNSVKGITNSPIPDFDGTLEGLKSISPDVLHVINANSQNYKERQKSAKTLTEKLATFGIENLYDLVTFFPRKYIDKSSPQSLKDLVVDEPATILGKIKSINELPNNMGIVFDISVTEYSSIKVTFWRQHWLKTKFHIGEEVMVTGKFALYRGKPNLNGTNIESAKEAAILPIVPTYKQSESKGITTSLILAAERELFARLTEIKLPDYLERPHRLNYYDAFKELHLPTTLAMHHKVIDNLAYYELVMMQLLIQNEKSLRENSNGLSMVPTGKNLQKKTVEKLSFSLTNSQNKAVEEINSKMASQFPASILLNADVGSGKTLVAQLACLQCVDSGYQAVMVGPTTILAQQLYNTLERLIEPLKGTPDEVRIAFLAPKMKVKDRRQLLSDLKDGTIDILVGTTGVMSDDVEYHNLGLICIDEQQKFGALQRSKLLSARQDGVMPDLLMQSATPIPRSTAQVFYGDIDMVLLDEKPAGRIPISTFWIKENPNDVLAQNVNEVWEDILQEAQEGNQAFIITPLVQESDKLDSASVQRTFKLLSEGALSNLRVGFVHGQMKNDEQNEVMKDFRDKKYDVIVASTVVEVGVDIPDATRMVVLSADRFGASSLHQIRGRIGRNNKKSVCYLVSDTESVNSVSRLQSLVDHENGFDVAKEDLLNRGEGTIFSSNQAGSSEMLFASLTKHTKLIPQARDEAIAILNSDNSMVALSDAKKMFQTEGRLM